MVILNFKRRMEKQESIAVTGSSTGIGFETLLLLDISNPTADTTTSLEDFLNIRKLANIKSLIFQYQSINISQSY